MPRAKKPKAIGLKISRPALGVGSPVGSFTPLDLPDDVDKRCYAIHEFVGGYFDCVHVKVDGKMLAMWVNDEGAINGTSIGFLFDHRPYFGSAVFTSHHEGKPCPVSAKQIAKHLHLFSTEPSS